MSRSFKKSQSMTYDFRKNNPMKDILIRCNTPSFLSRAMRNSEVSNWVEQKRSTLQFQKDIKRRTDNSSRIWDPLVQARSFSDQKYFPQTYQERVTQLQDRTIAPKLNVSLLWQMYSKNKSEKKVRKEMPVR